MTHKTSTIIGATGLIGSHLLQQLQDDDTFKSVNILVRREVGYTHPKVKEMVIDFEDLEAFKSGIKGSDVVFCAVGTTNKKVKGDKEAYRKVDYDIPVYAARFAEQESCSQFVLVSAIGANSQSKNFYTRLKGQVEDTIKQLNIPSILFFRPSLLLGNRQEARIGESIGKWIMKPVSFLLPSKMKPIQAADVAWAMQKASQSELQGVHVFHFQEMKQLLK
jgi:uncharacterized protein YbjT (DUF2867 family)